MFGTSSAEEAIPSASASQASALSLVTPWRYSNLPHCAMSLKKSSTTSQTSMCLTQAGRCGLAKALLAVAAAVAAPATNSLKTSKAAEPASSRASTLTATATDGKTATLSSALATAIALTASCSLAPMSTAL